MKNKNIVTGLSSVLALIATVGTTTPVFAHTQHYWNGYNDGQQQANNDYGVRYFDASCPTGQSHTQNYCVGYHDGYQTEWWSMGRDVNNGYGHTPAQQRIVEHIKAQQSIDQSSNVNIKGNKNRVVINQQANNGVNQPVSGYGYGHSSSGINARCAIFCANIPIR